MKAFVLFILFIFTLSLSELFAQNTLSCQWEEVIEQLSVASEDQDININNIIEELTERIQEPLNINTVTKEQLEQFSFLTDIQIENILAYLYIHGQMQTIYELQMVEDMDRQTIQYLTPFVYAEPVKTKEAIPSLKQILRYGKNEVLTRFDIPFYERKGYRKEYLGPAIYNSLRYSFRYKDHLYTGFTAEKDAGEPFGALHNTKGYDFYSFYFFLRNIGKLKALAVGNYRLSFGQGLVLSNDFIMGKTSALSTITSRNSQVKKHSSTDEYNYFRGLATTVQWNEFTFSGFYSHRSLDGITKDESITSINKTGQHRTQKEADRRGVLTLQATGGNVSYHKNGLKVGATGIYYFFDKPYYPQVREYSKYNLRGNNFHNLGIDYKYRWNRFTFIGETAIGKGGGMATLNTVSYSPVSSYQFMFVQRYYSRDYWAFFARSFSEGGYVQNESGYYLAVEASPIRHWKFFLSADYFRFPWLKYLIDKPSSGFDGIVQSTYSPCKNLNMFLRYQYKQKEKNYTNTDKTKSVQPIYHHKWRYRLNYVPVDQLTLRFTFDYNAIYPKPAKVSDGFQFVQSVGYAFKKVPLKLELQGSYFHTDDYASRVYSYEKGMLNSFYSPSFYGIGNRLAMHVRWDIHKNWMVMAKYGQTTYYDREEIGSGNDLIYSNRKQDLQVQVKVKF
ncbi:helix-hairpin-helix domain-containing protein [Bacteroides sp. 224]|uniref:helix-hairpin-helix domain-containing protein n=1 Tax=Bacteroides sp. 224 TaxID=2302936 RepID=UPI0013D6B5C1|nr:helix-hairpin-helix domain-containing protein [Bacteroides sp. 224]NDV65454.1 helix-hairpin-helix domain-containing protein [Bacteroides sp. 224]